jgi:hypothetical protein
LPLAQPGTDGSRIIDAPACPGGSAGQVAQLLGGVPEQFVALGAVDGEPRVLVAALGGVERRDRRGDVRRGAGIVDVAGGEVAERQRRAGA